MNTIQNKEQDLKALDELFYEVGTYRNSKDLRELLAFIKHFKNLAPYNAFLIHVQKPGSRYVASAEDWRYKYQRKIKPGARPLIILQPFGPVQFVFELGDTEEIKKNYGTGETKIPEEILHPFKTEGTIKISKYDCLFNNLITDGIQYYETDYAKSYAGGIETVKQKYNIMYGDMIIEIYYHMLINRNYTKEEKFATIVHELAHLYCGHLGTPNTSWWPDFHNKDKNTQEFEAESVTWLVCEWNNIKNPSASYLNGYLNKNGEIPNVSLENILRASGMIERRLYAKQKVRDNLIKNKEELKKKRLEEKRRKEMKKASTKSH